MALDAEIKYGSWIRRNLEGIRCSSFMKILKKILRGVTEDNHEQYEPGFGGFLAEIQTKFFPNTSLERYYQANTLSMLEYLPFPSVHSNWKQVHLTLDLSVGCGITFCPYVGTRVLKC
jgi:hypothetical protein